MIFAQDIKKERQQKWRVSPAKPEGHREMRTLDDAREFLNSVGFCLAYPVKPAALAPTFIGAYVGSEEKLPTAKLAFSDENARAATELVVRLLSEKSAFEVAFGEDGSLLVSAAEFPYFYALIGDRNPKVAPSPGPRGEQALTTHTFEVIDEFGPINEDEMRRKLEREISRNAIEKVLHSLWSKLRITRVDSGLESGEPVEPIWDMMNRWAPEAVNRGKQISAAEALSALISKYLETVIVAEQKEVEDFFGHLVPRSKVTEVCKALLAAQEFTYVQVSGKNMLQLASRAGAEEVSTPTAAAADAKVHKVRPWQAREEGKRASEEKRAKYAARPPKVDATAPPGGAFQKFSKDRKSFGERKAFGERKEFGKRKPSGERKEFGARKPFGDRGPKKFGERKPFGDRPKPFSERKSFGDKPPFSKDRPPREGGEKRELKKPFGERKSFGDRPKPFGERKSFGDRPKSSERKPFGERKSFGDRPKPLGERKTFGGKNRPSHGRERFAGKSEGGGFKKDYPPRRREGAEGKSGFKKDYPPRGDRPGKSFGAKKSFGAGKSFGGKKPFGKPSGKPFAKRKPATGERSAAPWLREKKAREKKPPREGPAE